MTRPIIGASPKPNILETQPSTQNPLFRYIFISTYLILVFFFTNSLANGVSLTQSIVILYHLSRFRLCSNPLQYSLRTGPFNIPPVWGSRSPLSSCSQVPNCRRLQYRHVVNRLRRFGVRDRLRHRNSSFGHQLYRELPAVLSDLRLRNTKCIWHLVRSANKNVFRRTGRSVSRVDQRCGQGQGNWHRQFSHCRGCRCGNFCSPDSAFPNSSQ